MADLKCNLVLGCLVIANSYRCMSSWFNTDSQCYLRHGDIFSPVTFKHRVSGNLKLEFEIGKLETWAC